MLMATAARFASSREPSHYQSFMPRRIPDPELVARVLKLARAGCSASNIQRTLGVPRSTITRWVRAAGPSATHDTPPPASATSVAIEAAVAVLGDEWTAASVAELAQVSQDAVRIWRRARVDAQLARMNLPPEAVRTELEFSGMRV